MMMVIQRKKVELHGILETIAEDIQSLLQFFMQEVALLHLMHEVMLPCHSHPYDIVVNQSWTIHCFHDIHCIN